MELDGKSYTWDGRRWYESRSFTVPPEAVIARLNTCIRDRLLADDAAVDDPSILLERAKHARESGQLQRSLQLVRRALKLCPDDAGALAVLCSVLRKQGAPQDALDETEAFRRSSYPPLLTSRAAAMCDLGRWEEAKRVIGQVLAMPGNHAEAFQVVHRIKAARPDLYEG